MFQGTIPTAMRHIVNEAVQAWNSGELWVGCSGNFTIERTLTGRTLHSNDVTAYSSALGWWSAGEPVPYTLRRDDLDWLAQGLDNGPGTLATVMLGTRFFASLDKQDNLYHRRVVEGYRTQWPTVYAKTLANIQRSSLRTASYHAMDVRQWLDEVVPRDGAVLCFPPFYSGDYEYMFAALDEAFDWPRPHYDLLDEDGKQDLIDAITDRPNWLIGLHEAHPDLEPYLHGRVQTANRGVPINLYASHAPPRVVTPSQKVSRILTRRLSRGEAIGDTPRLAILDKGQFTTLRSQYMNASIQPGSPLIALALIVDERIIGCFAYTKSNYRSNQGYLLSDFPVAPTDYPRLSQLVVRAAASAEGIALLQRALSERIVSLYTTAYTDRPVSMKYRGAGMKLAKRADDPQGRHKYALNYETQDLGLPLADVLHQWKKKNA